LGNVLPGSGIFTGRGVLVNGNFDPSVAGAGPHSITYTYTATNTCSNSVNQTIFVDPTPVADAGPDKFVLEGGFITLTPVQVNNIPVTYEWTPANYLNNPSIANAQASPPTDFTYTLTVISDKGCRDDDQVFVTLLKSLVIPNIFSPNGDGIHARWVIGVLDTYPGCTVEVFNRYGQRIYYSVGYSNPWDGTVNGKPVPVGTYYYIVDPKNGRQKQAGYVDIVR
jgi:gliding motility-associated-like protein